MSLDEGVYEGLRFLAFLVEQFFWNSKLPLRSEAPREYLPQICQAKTKA